MKSYTYIIISYNAITEKDEVIYTSTNYQEALKEFDRQQEYPNINSVYLEKWCGYERTTLKVK